MNDTSIKLLHERRVIVHSSLVARQNDLIKAENEVHRLSALVGSAAKEVADLDEALGMLRVQQALKVRSGNASDGEITEEKST